MIQSVVSAQQVLPIIAVLAGASLAFFTLAVHFAIQAKKADRKAMNIEKYAGTLQKSLDSKNVTVKFTTERATYFENEFRKLYHIQQKLDIARGENALLRGDIDKRNVRIAALEQALKQANLHVAEWINTCAELRAHMAQFMLPPRTRTVRKTRKK